MQSRLYDDTVVYSGDDGNALLEVPPADLLRPPNFQTETDLMQTSDTIRCRLAACREDLNDDNVWSFYLINDSAVAIDSVTLKEIWYEWGDMANRETTDVSITDLAPGAFALIWRDNGSGAENRMTLTLRVQMSGRVVGRSFEFPKLYKMVGLSIVDGLGKPGWQESSEA